MWRQTFIHTLCGGKEGQKVALMTRAVTVVLLYWQCRGCREGARQIAAQAVGILAIISGFSHRCQNSHALKRFLHIYVLHFEAHLDMVYMYHWAESQRCNASWPIDTPDASIAEGTKKLYGAIKAVPSTKQLCWSPVLYWRLCPRNNLMLQELYQHCT